MSDWPEERPETDHFTVQGEHMARIAAIQGMRSYEPIWNHSKNARLKALRKTPHILAPDDEVFVPAVKSREVDKETEKRHRFRAKLGPLVLRVKRLHFDGSPIDEAPKSVTRDGKAVDFTTNAGVIEVPLEPLSAKCAITTSTTETVSMIGFLDPVSMVSGFRERLNNLGYRAGRSESASDLDIRSAVEEFQCDHKLTVDGKCGEATQHKLVEVHGC